MTTPDTSGIRGSIVIPAHNEARVIGRCLANLQSQPGIEDVLVVVAANGCTDDTVAVARAARLPHLQVLDLPQAGKIVALNAGDEAAGQVFPRVYLDADITLGADTLQQLLTALDVPDAVVASPWIRFDRSQADAGVRLFYSIFEELPYVRSGLIGLGVYGLSRAGRARFGAWPPVTADDLFAQRLFGADERRITGGTFLVTVPANTTNLIKVRTRVARGNTELAHETAGEHGDFGASTSSTMSALGGIVRRQPWRAPAAAWYVAVTTVARVRARRSSAGTWDRDDSTR